MQVKHIGVYNITEGKHNDRPPLNISPLYRYTYMYMRAYTHISTDINLDYLYKRKHVFYFASLLPRWNTDQKQPGEERIYWAYTPTS